MFNSLFKYYSNCLKKPSLFFNTNIWLYTRIQIFNLFICNKLIYMIESLSSLKINLLFKQLKIFSFVNFYRNYLITYTVILLFYILV